ncbi:MAG: hypothetical protein ABEJ23_06370 [Haloarculaceae archaeon]
MRFKVVPPARGLETLAAAQAALPLVPDDETTCCARLMRDTDVPAQDEAKEWLTFLRALGLAALTDSGYRRIQDDPDPAVLAQRFRERVYGADALLAALADADRPLTAGAAFDRFDVPEWERRRYADWETVWRERVERVLEWAVALDLATATPDGYR